MKSASRLLEGRASYRSTCTLPIQYRLNSAGRWLTARLVDISEGGLAFSAKREIPDHAMVEIIFPILHVNRPITFRIRQRKITLGGLETYGARVCPDFRKAYGQLVEQIRNIQVWREVERYLRRKAITMEQAVRSWFRHHQPIEPPSVHGAKKHLHC